MPGTAGSLEKLTPELAGIDAMLGNLAIAQENHGHIQVVTFSQDGVGVDIHFAQSCAEFRE